MSLRYQFSALLWRSTGSGAWHFLTLPKQTSGQIRQIAGPLLNSFGSLRVTAAVGEASWATSLFYDTKAGAFFLPVKSEVRRKAKIAVDDCVRAAVEIAL